VLERKQKDEDIKKAQFDKQFAIFNIAVKTAEAIAIVKAKAAIAGVFTPAGIAYLAQIPFLIASGVLQAAIVLAKPIPKYKHGKGVHDNYEGAAIVGDGGKSELHVKEDGSFEITPDKPTVTHVKRNDLIFPDAAKTLMNMATVNTARRLGGAVVTEKNYSDAMTKTLGNKLDNLERTIKNKKEHHWFFDRHELRHQVKTPFSSSENLNTYLFGE